MRVLLCGWGWMGWRGVGGWGLPVATVQFQFFWMPPKWGWPRVTYCTVNTQMYSKHANIFRDPTFSDNLLGSCGVRPSCRCARRGGPETLWMAVCACASPSSPKPRPSSWRAPPLIQAPSPSTLLMTCALFSHSTQLQQTAQSVQTDAT